MNELVDFKLVANEPTRPRRTPFVFGANGARSLTRARRRSVADAGASVELPLSSGPRSRRAPAPPDPGVMGASASKMPETKPKKICCACPITKNARDACIPEHDEEKCKYLIDAHLRCLRDEGFDV